MRLGYFAEIRRLVSCRVALALALIFVLPLPVAAQENEQETKQASDEQEAALAHYGDVPAKKVSDNVDADRDAMRPHESGTAEYIIGEGDVLRIKVWKEPDVSQNSITVRPDGMISLPLLGVVKVSELTPSEIQEMLTSKFSRYLTKPQVTVTVAQIRSKSVYLTGEVKKPGIYQLTGPMDIMQLIIKAGGLNVYAHARNISVLRTVDGKTQKIHVNYKQLLRGNNIEQNVMLVPGDTIVIP
jgi:polysaccharide export outer membrane protein